MAEHPIRRPLLAGTPPSANDRFQVSPSHIANQLDLSLHVHTSIMKNNQPNAFGGNGIEPPEVEVVIEVPRGSFLKRGSTGQVDFVSPLPCPFNYGSIENFIGLEGDLLDAVVLGPRLRYGARVHVKAYGAVGLTDRGMYDDKLICACHPISVQQKRFVLAFFWFYAKCKSLLNLIRRQPGRNALEGWGDAKAAIARAKPRDEVRWTGPEIRY